jgi:DNA-binding Lrp family transcriptional regulator
MAIGFVLITTEPGKERDVRRNLYNLDKVLEVVPLFGEYDAIAKIETKDFNDLGVYVMENVRKIDYIKDTKTLAGMNLR